MHIEKWIDYKEQFSTLGNHTWSVSRLIELSKELPIMDVPIDHLNVWHKYENLRMRDMVSHFQAILDADLSYPIILDEDGDIMDGRHRIMKAMLDGITTIKAVRFDKNPEPCKVNNNAD